MDRFDRPTIPELPSPDPGVTLIETDDPTGPLHALAVDHLLADGGHGYWIGSHGHARTDVLADVAPSNRILDRIHVARGFTPHQHHELVATLANRKRIDPGLIVAPAVDGQYRDDSLRRGEATEFLLRTLARLAGLARRHQCPVVLTHVSDDAFSEPVSELATQTVRCESTPMGPRFVGADFETLVYPREDGWIQTTLAFWAEVLCARESLYSTTTTPVEAPAYGTN